MRKIKMVAFLLIFIALSVFIFFASTLSGGIKGLWYDVTKPTLNPYSSAITEKRNLIKNQIVTDFDYIDRFSNTTKYGIHNTDLCVKEIYGWKNPIGLFNHLYSCKYISQRYYGLDGDYESIVRSLIEYITENKEGLSFQPYQIEQLFVQKDWMDDTVTVNKIIAAHNSSNKDSIATNIYEVISFIEGQNEHTVHTYSPSNDGYYVRLDLFDVGVSPSAIESSYFFEKGDSPDLRDEYITDIREKHDYGVVVTITNSYYEK